MERIKEAVNNKKFGVEAEILKNLKKKFEKSEKETSVVLYDRIQLKFGVEAEIHKKMKKKFEKSEKETMERIKEAVNNKKFDVETEMYKNLKEKFEKSEKETSEKIKNLEKEIEELKISMKNNKSTVNNVQINQFFFKTDDF
uniref:Uncharacterized protein n=1 Tax=Panagrolaimus sp. JU765 TaxID=591449 RepID=A0AC34QVC9_9BILA